MDFVLAKILCPRCTGEMCVCSLWDCPVAGCGPGGLGAGYTIGGGRPSCVSRKVREHWWFEIGELAPGIFPNHKWLPGNLSDHANAHMRAKTFLAKTKSVSLFLHRNSVHNRAALPSSLVPTHLHSKFYCNLIFNSLFNILFLYKLAHNCNARHLLIWPSLMWLGQGRQTKKIYIKLFCLVLTILPQL